MAGGVSCSVACRLLVPQPGIELASPALEDRFLTTGPPRCCCLVAQSCPSLYDPMDCSMPGFPVLHYLPELSEAHDHWVNDAIQLSHPLSSPSPAFNLSQHQGLFQWVSCLHQVAKVLELQHHYQSFQTVFKVDFLNLLVWSPCSPRDFQESSPAPEFKGIDSSVLCLHYCAAFTSIHDYWKDHTEHWLYGPLLAKSCLCFLTLSRFVIAFLPRSI